MGVLQHHDAGKFDFLIGKSLELKNKELRQITLKFSRKR